MKKKIIDEDHILPKEKEIDDAINIIKIFILRI